MCSVLEDNGMSYAGPVNITIGGEVCERWEIESAEGLPERNVTLAYNYCRNPDAEC